MAEASGGQPLTMPTAEALGRFHKELLAAGIQDGETVRYLVQAAGRQLLEDQGLGIKTNEEVGRDG
jgi:hypothetical protein